MRFINKFSDHFPKQLNEDAGYGNDYFADEKVEKSQYYFFKIGEGEEEIGLILKIGKFSRSGVISENEKNYGVLHLEIMDTDDMDDYLVNDSEYRSREDEMFSLSSEVLSQAFFIITKSMDNYLQKNPKVTKFYDEILENLDMPREEYMEFISPKIRSWSRKRWKIQEGQSEKSLIYTKVSHE
jgi:hypothetical protein